MLTCYNYQKQNPGDRLRFILASQNQTILFNRLSINLHIAISAYKQLPKGNLKKKKKTRKNSLDLWHWIVLSSVIAAAIEHSNAVT